MIKGGRAGVLGGWEFRITRSIGNCNSINESLVRFLDDHMGSDGKVKVSRLLFLFLFLICKMVFNYRQ